MKNKKFMSRLFSAVLAGAMVLSMAPAAFAAATDCKHPATSRSDYKSGDSYATHTYHCDACGADITEGCLASTEYVQHETVHGFICSICNLEYSNAPHKFDDDNKCEFCGYEEPIVEPQPTEKTVYINFYSEVEGKQVAEEGTTVAFNAVKVAATEVYDLCPEGYEIVSSSYQINDGYVYVAVKPVETPAEPQPTEKTVYINFYSEDEEKQIAEVEIEVAADADYINTSILTAPKGYEIAPTGDMPIRDGYVYVSVRKVATKTITVHFMNTNGGEEVATVKVDVAADAKTFTAVAPEGYVIATEDAEYPVMDDVYVSVTAKAADSTPVAPVEPVEPTKPNKVNLFGTLLESAGLASFFRILFMALFHI